MTDNIKYFVSERDAEKYIDHLEELGYVSKRLEILPAGNVPAIYIAMAYEAGCEIIFIIRVTADCDLRTEFYNAELDTWPHPHYVEE